MSGSTRVLPPSVFFLEQVDQLKEVSTCTLHLSLRVLIRDNWILIIISFVSRFTSYLVCIILRYAYIIEILPVYSSTVFGACELVYTVRTGLIKPFGSSLLGTWVRIKRLSAHTK
ncbi:hypothetical protein F4678DRAFT_59036 [Xylaria arbuscula]|nr:hypothetical protein F4678DRAFT_59036 [Xylaria arbuscula]